MHKGQTITCAVLLFLAVQMRSQQATHGLFAGLSYGIGETKVSVVSKSKSSRTTTVFPAKSQSLFFEWYSKIELYSFGIRISNSEMQVKYGERGTTFQDYDGTGSVYRTREEGYEGEYSESSSRLGVFGTVRLGLFRPERNPRIKLYLSGAFGTERVHNRKIEENYHYRYSRGSGVSVGPSPDYEYTYYSYFDVKDSMSFTEKFFIETPSYEKCFELFISTKAQLTKRMRITAEISRRYYSQSSLSDIVNRFNVRNRFVSFSLSYLIIPPNQKSPSGPK